MNPGQNRTILQVDMFTTGFAQTERTTYSDMTVTVRHRARPSYSQPYGEWSAQSSACLYDGGNHSWVTVGCNGLQCYKCGIMSEDPTDTDSRV